MFFFCLKVINEFLVYLEWNFREEVYKSCTLFLKKYFVKFFWGVFKFKN